MHNVWDKCSWCNIKKGRLFKIDRRLIPYTSEWCCLSAIDKSSRSKRSQYSKCERISKCGSKNYKGKYAYRCLCKCSHLSTHAKSCILFIYMHEHVFTCTCTFHWTPSLPIQCLQHRKAEALCFNPPSKVLAGLSADAMIIVPQKCWIVPSTTKGTPESCIDPSNNSITAVHIHVHVHMHTNEHTCTQCSFLQHIFTT